MIDHDYDQELIIYAYTVDLRPDGYPRLAEVIACKEDFMMYRRFGHLQARLLLNKQDELRALEVRLADLDEWFENKHPDRNYCRERVHAESIEYRDLLAMIENSMKEYGKLILLAHSYKAYSNIWVVCCSPIVNLCTNFCEFRPTNDKRLPPSEELPRLQGSTVRTR